MTAVGAPILRDVVRVSGPDASRWLQGQLSQDLDQLAVATSTWTLLLDPDGKLGYWLRTTKVATDAFVLDVDGGAGSGVVSRLERFKLRTKADIERLDWAAVAVRGADAPRGDVPDGVLRLALTARHGPGYDLLGPGAGLPAGVSLVDDSAIDRIRIAHGIPAAAAELAGPVIPAEVGAWFTEASVSFTKGCFTGQELTARIDSRGGNAPRRLRILATDGPVHVGDEVVAGDAPVGTITSVAAAGDLALAFCARKVADHDVVRIGAVGAVVHDDPVLSET